jgi:Cytochrome c7 and related cytochrome c
MRLPLVLGGAVGAGLLGWAVIAAVSRLGVQKGYAPEQPIAFPHSVHAGTNRIPCLYCHYGARTSRHAGIPSESVCMNCHSMLEKQTVEIEKLKEAVQVGRPIAWVKVHNLPDFVYFNHSQHVLSGVACERCHGSVDHMDRIEQASPLTMGWCLDCHRDNAHVPRASLQRAALAFGDQPKPAAGLDCASCHY